MESSDARAKRPHRAAARAVELGDGARDTPIFMAHGDHDEVVQPERGRAARDSLRELGLAPSWHGFSMGHEICLEQIETLGAWLGEAFAD